MSRDSIRFRNAKEPSCRTCGYWRKDATHRPAADCPEQPCVKPDEHHPYDGPESAVWDEDTAALLAVADAVAALRDCPDPFAVVLLRDRMYAALSALEALA